MSAVANPQSVIGFINLETYRKRMAEYILRNREHITIHKLRTNQPISKSELGKLNRIFFAHGEYGTHEQFGKAYAKYAWVSLYVQSLIWTILQLMQPLAVLSTTHHKRSPDQVHEFDRKVSQRQWSSGVGEII